MGVTPDVRLLSARWAGVDERGLRVWARRVGASLGREHVSRSYRFPYAVVAAHDAPVGVDLERLEPVTRAFALSIATPEEAAALGIGAAGDDVSAWAIGLWSGKEALAKALGDALAYEPRRLGSPMLWPELRAGSWHAARLHVPGGHVGWVCWRGADVAETGGPWLAPQPATRPWPVAELPECPDSGIPAGTVPGAAGAAGAA